MGTGTYPGLDDKVHISRHLPIHLGDGGGIARDVEEKKKIEFSAIKGG